VNFFDLISHDTLAEFNLSLQLSRSLESDQLQHLLEKLPSSDTRYPLSLPPASPLSPGPPQSHLSLPNLFLSNTASVFPIDHSAGMTLPRSPSTSEPLEELLSTSNPSNSFFREKSPSSTARPLPLSLTTFLSTSFVSKTRPNSHTLPSLLRSVPRPKRSIV